MQSVVQHTTDAISLGSIYALLALGVALLFGIMQLINFAHGELILVGGYSLFLFSDWPLLLAIAASLAIVAAAAVLMERLAFRPIRGADASTLLVTSFAISYFLQNSTILAFSSQPKSVALSPFFAESFQIGDLRIAKLSIVVIAVTIVLITGLVVLLRKTMIGTQMRAASEDFKMARLLGVPANRVIVVAFSISGLLAGVAALFLVAQTGGVSPQMGLAPVIIAFVATVIGGMGSLAGAALGGFGLGVVSTLLQVALPEDLRPYRDAFVFALVIVVLLFRPEGLIPNAAARVRV